MTNFKFMANAVITTEEAVEAMERSGNSYEAAGADLRYWSHSGGLSLLGHKAC